MNKIITLSLLFGAFPAFGQSFPGPYGQPGSTAIPKDSTCFVAWATEIVIEKGYLDINDTNAAENGSNKASYGEPEYALGPAQGSLTNVVSLGDGGIATLTFEEIITNGPGWDFAIFENGFIDGYMELAHVEVSSDGGTFFRFPSTSEISTEEQYTNSTIGNCAEVDNLAGKYRNGFGTPFDLDDLPDNLLLDKMHITHVRIIDAVGSVNEGGTTDQFGTVINDPYPTVFPSCGFDLDGIGIINKFAGIAENTMQAKIWPNPVKDQLFIQLEGSADLRITDLAGKVICALQHNGLTVVPMNELALTSGIYFVEIASSKGRLSQKFVIQ